jgi:hypothetical protein
MDNKKPHLSVRFFVPLPECFNPIKPDMHINHIFQLSFAMPVKKLRSICIIHLNNILLVISLFITGSVNTQIFTEKNYVAIAQGEKPADIIRKAANVVPSQRP